MAEWKDDLRPRLAPLRLDPAREAEIIEELSQHLDDRYQELRRGGASDADARHVALEELQNEDTLARGIGSLRQSRIPAPIPPGGSAAGISGLGQDVRYAARTLRKHAGLTTTIVLTLALGIGANSAMFSLLNAVVLRALPVPAPERLFALRADFPVASGNRLSGPMFDRLRHRVPAGADAAAMSRVARVYTRTHGTDQVQPAALQLVSSNYFRVLGAIPVLGQPLPDDAEHALAGSGTAVVSHSYWQRRFAAAADIVGRSLVINGVTFTVAGVAPEGFDGVWLESPVDVWVPLIMQRAVNYAQNFSADGADQSRPWLFEERIWWLDVIVAADPKRAEAAAAAFTALAREGTGADGRLRLEPFSRGFSSFRQRFATPLLALSAMAALVLLITCANVANVLLARAAGRQREIALRMSLGAGRRRLVRQFLTESSLLVLMAAAAAVLFAGWSGQVLVRAATASVTGSVPFSAGIDLPVLAFTAAVALISLLLFGVLPAARSTRLDLAAALRMGAHGAAGSQTARPARVLVVLQVALSLVLVTATGLIVRTFHNLLNVDLGFDAARVLSVQIDPRLLRTTPAEIPLLQQRLLDGVAAVPGVSSAALAMCGLHSNCRAREDGFEIEGYQAAPGEQIVFLVNAVAPNYFSTVGMRLVAGRGLSERDLENTPRVAVVNKSLAAKYFEDGNAVGKRFGTTSLDVEIVGVVDDARLLTVKDPPVPTAYFALAQRGLGARFLEIRTAGEPRQSIAPVRAAILQAVPGLTIESIAAIEDRVSVSLREERLVLFLTSGFGALALAIAGFGLFAVLSHAVVRRAGEFGVRMALGASRGRVLWSVARESLWLVLCGLMLGAPIVYLGGRVVSTLVFGVSPYDWVTLLAATFTMGLVGVVSTTLPALRASRVDPMVVLRSE